MKKDYYYENIIIGGSLESLLYSFVSEIPIFINEELIPFDIEKIENVDDFKFLGYEGEIQKSELWQRLTFLLSMNGLIVVPNFIKNIRNERKSLVISTSDNSRIKINYSKKIDFDKISTSSVNVYDWFDVRSGSVHEYDTIEDKGSRFVNKLFFYPSRRIGQTSNKKDVVAFSKIRSNTLLDYESSESYVRLKALKMMKEKGIRGTPNGFNKKGIRLHYAIKIEHSHREIIKNYKPLYSIEEILNKRKRSGETWNLTKKLFRHKQISTLRESYRLQDNL